ncbi:MAG TPA: hypothetical protein DDX19_18070 [Rhodopirellula baltica]|uniref:Uncharacterized protein n=1 Tax=Rhodopirellula baltica (strain DSM 10527 / NCIMB 13988 / SH1) TaxID=243090 RepID=Q7UIT1_RHOBA|nr:hypothetical protein [Rhodopirellula baltica]CAD77531.1 hypothetical protein-transmembrane prediction [Rhodopirellula baltica SH 1]HBE64612.1 hypothetical protein [Rhodopirellula baltica]
MSEPVSLSNETSANTSGVLRRRTRFQLTPLMDLLLIIVFAQFLEMRETSQEQTQEIEQERQALLDEQTMWRAERDQAVADRNMALATQQANTQDVSRALEMLRGWLNLDAESSEQANLRSSADSGDVIARAIERSRQLASADPNTLIRFLVGHDELLKRAEVWTVHARETGDVVFDASGYTETFRLESRRQAQRTEEIADRLFAAYKQSPQPKGLIVVLVSYAPRSVAGVYQPLIDAMPATLERLRADTPTSRFEYTILGAAQAPEQANNVDNAEASTEPENLTPLQGNPDDA